MSLVPRRSPDQSLSNRVGYRIDRFLGLHPAVQLVAVLNVAIVLAFLFGTAIYLLDTSGRADGRSVGSLGEGFWWAITRLLDGGTVAGDGRTGFVRQGFGIGVTLLGLVAVTVLAQSVQQRGAFGVARAILSLDSLSIYHYAPELFTGLTFDDAHASIRSGILVGLVRDGAPMLSPPGAEVIGPGDLLLVFSDLDVRPRIAGVPDRRVRLPSAPVVHGPAPLLRLLILRVRPGLAEILELLDARGAVQATVLAPEDEIDRAREAVRLASLHRTTTRFLVGDPLDCPRSIASSPSRTTPRCCSRPTSSPRSRPSPTPTS